MSQHKIADALLFNGPIHGLQQSVRTSKDLCEGAPVPRSRDDIVNVIYTIGGEPFFRFHLSSTFAAAHGLVAGVREGQDDDNLEWDRCLVRCCVKCFLQRNGGWFDVDSWWHPGQQPSGR